MDNSREHIHSKFARDLRDDILATLQPPDDDQEIYEMLVNEWVWQLGVPIPDECAKPDWLTESYKGFENRFQQRGRYTFLEFLNGFQGVFVGKVWKFPHWLTPWTRVSGQQQLKGKLHKNSIQIPRWISCSASLLKPNLFLIAVNEHAIVTNKLGISRIVCDGKAVQVARPFEDPGFFTDLEILSIKERTVHRTDDESQTDYLHDINLDSVRLALSKSSNAT